MRRSALAALTFGVVLLVPASAAPITGQLNITGDATVTTTVLTFLCDIVAAQPCPANYGNMAVTGSAAQSGDFTSLANTYGYIHSLDETTTPINQSFTLSDFIMFAADPDIRLDLTFIAAGTGGACPPSGSAACTPQIPALVTAANPLGLSPFNLANTPTGSIASFSVAGEARRVSTGELSPFGGVFTAQFTNTPGTTDADVASILAQLANQGSITTSYSATFKATMIPEPATEALLLGGLLVLAGIRWRKRPF